MRTKTDDAHGGGAWLGRLLGVGPVGGLSRPPPPSPLLVCPPPPLPAFPAFAPPHAMPYVALVLDLCTH